VSSCSSRPWTEDKEQKVVYNALCCIAARVFVDGSLLAVPK